jgi:hypothetical protein
MVDALPSSHLLKKSVELSGKPIFTNLPIYKTQSDKLRTTLSWRSSPSKTTPITHYGYPSPTRVIHSKSRLLSPSTHLDPNPTKGKLVCSPQPTSSNIKADFTTKNESDSSEDEMPNVVKYVTVFSLMAFAGGYSAGYGPGEDIKAPNKSRAKTRFQINLDHAQIGGAVPVPFYCSVLRGQTRSSQEVWLYFVFERFFVFRKLKKYTYTYTVAMYGDMQWSI